VPRRPAAVMRTTPQLAAHRPLKCVRHLPVQKKPVLPPLRPHRLPPGRQLRNPGRPALRVTRWMPTARLPLPRPTRQVPHPILQQRVLLPHRQQRPSTDRHPRAAKWKGWPPLMYPKMLRAHRPRVMHWLIRYAKVPRYSWRPLQSARPNCSSWLVRWDWMSQPPLTVAFRPRHKARLTTQSQPRSRRTSRRSIPTRTRLQAAKERPQCPPPWQRLCLGVHRDHRPARLSPHRMDAWRPQDARALRPPCP